MEQENSFNSILRCETIRAEIEHYDDLLYHAKQEFYEAGRILRTEIDDLTNFNEHNDADLRLCIQHRLEQIIACKITINKYEQYKEQLNDQARARDEKDLDKRNPYYPWQPEPSFIYQPLLKKYNLNQQSVEHYAHQWLAMDLADFKVYLQQEQQEEMSGREFLELCTCLMSPVTLRLIRDRINQLDAI